MHPKGLCLPPNGGISLKRNLERAAGERHPKKLIQKLPHLSGSGSGKRHVSWIPAFAWKKKEKLDRVLVENAWLQQLLDFVTQQVHLAVAFNFRLMQFLEVDLLQKPFARPVVLAFCVSNPDKVFWINCHNLAQNFLVYFTKLCF